MRIAIVSDIHGNLTALEAVLADLREQGPDIVYHLGDLVANGYRPAEVLDRVRDLGWSSVVGNTDEMLWRPELLGELAARAPGRQVLRKVLFEKIAPATVALLGPQRLAWLKELPLDLRSGDLALQHAGIGNLWRAPMANATPEELEAAFARLGAAQVVYGHIHHPFVRRAGHFIVANAGAVSLSYDGDPRASYLLLDDGRFEIRRIQYDIEQETRGLLASNYPHADWLSTLMRTGRYTAPNGPFADCVPGWRQVRP
jgi:putative phosphoesterase